MKRSWRWPLAGFVVGGLVGATLLTVNIVGAFVGDPAGVGALAPQVDSGFKGEILHTPPLLVPRGQAVKLAYEVVCAPSADRPGACSPQGSVHVRRVGDQEFAEVPLAADSRGRLSATIGAGYTLGAGFDYYVDVEDGRGSSQSLPAAGHDAPQYVWTVMDETNVDLPEHVFGRTRAPGEIVAAAKWGSGDRQLGLSSGHEQARIGPSAFDVARAGSVVVLDQVNRRLAVYPRGGAQRNLPIPFDGGEGDLAVGGDGTIYVLDDGGAAAPIPVVRSFESTGRAIAGTPIAERVADMIRVGPDGPLVHGYPSELWFPTGVAKPPLSPAEQAIRARPGRAVAGGLEVVVHASPGQARFALVRGGRIAKSWLVKSATSLGEVQLAEPYRDGLLVVLRLWTESQAEFRVLRLAPSGLADSFSVDRAEWAESAALSRFRLHGDTLYQLRSDRSGVEIAAFEIGGTK
jgi:hypothetical protein